MSLPKSLLKVTLKSHSQSHSQVTSKGHSQKSLPMDALHTQPRLSPASADHLLHLLGVHPGLPIDQDTFVTSAPDGGQSGRRGWSGRRRGGGSRSLNHILRIRQSVLYWPQYRLKVRTVQDYTGRLKRKGCVWMDKKV